MELQVVSHGSNYRIQGGGNIDSTTREITTLYKAAKN